MPDRMLTRALRRAYSLMRGQFGHQQWWPGETPFEVCVGAILTQNTNWGNVERAIANLKAARVLDPRKLFALPEPELARLIRPAGYFNVKARRLRAFLRILVEEYDADLKRLFAGGTETVRTRLLGIHGIGPETADSLLLYAGGQPSFEIDAYTQRIFKRHGWAAAKFRSKGGTIRQDAWDYDALKALCEASLNQKRGAARLDYWQDYHAQLVSVGKHYCRPREARCESCPLRSLLPAQSRGGPVRPLVRTARVKG
jgi:endonuclease-3 related protein